MSRTNHHRGQKNSQCKDLWGRRGDMGTNSHYSSYNRNLATRKERRESKPITPIRCMIEIDSAFDDRLIIESIGEYFDEINLSIMAINK